MISLLPAARYSLTCDRVIQQLVGEMSLTALQSCQKCSVIVISSIQHVVLEKAQLFGSSDPRPLPIRCHKRRVQG